MAIQKREIMRCLRCGYKPSDKGRSTPQNRYYWGCVIQTLSDELGYTRDEMHDVIKHKFLKEHRIIKGREGKAVELEVSGSTAKLDTKQFEDLMSQIRMWASRDLNVYIKEPNES